MRSLESTPQAVKSVGMARAIDSHATSVVFLHLCFYSVSFSG